MKKVYLHFREFELGFLTQQENMFVWVPNAENICKFFEKYDGAKDLFTLDTTNPEAYSEVPYPFSDYLAGCARVDIVKQANINSDDTDFEKLCKLATIQFFNQDFVIKI